MKTSWAASTMLLLKDEEPGQSGFRVSDRAYPSCTSQNIEPRCPHVCGWRQRFLLVGQGPLVALPSACRILGALRAFVGGGKGTRTPFTKTAGFHSSGTVPCITGLLR